MPELRDWSSILDTSKSTRKMLMGLKDIRNRKNERFELASKFFAEFKDKKIAIFGAGEAGYSCFRLSRYICKVVCFFDNDVSKTGSFIDNIEVRSPQDICIVDIDAICIASQFYEDIYLQLSTFEMLDNVSVLVWKS